MTKHLRFRSGGTLALDLALDLFSLSERERDFVFGLIDRIREFEEKETDHSSD